MTEFDSKIISSKDSKDNSFNRNWWQENPMTYDWDKKLGEQQYTNQYFASIDNIFGEGHSLLNNPNWPDGRILENFLINVTKK